MAKRYQVRGPHGGSDYAKWTVVDTTQRDIAVHTARRKKDAQETADELNAANWPTEADEEATRELVALGDRVGVSGMALVRLYLDVEAILMRHDRNPRKLLDAMHYLSQHGNE